jgi:hypothetical protein
MVEEYQTKLKIRSWIYYSYRCYQRRPF